MTVKTYIEKWHEFLSKEIDVIDGRTKYKKLDSTKVLKDFGNRTIAFVEKQRPNKNTEITLEE